MKIKIIIIILFLIVSVCSIAQDKSTYLQYSINMGSGPVSTYAISSEYFDGKEWFFTNGQDYIAYGGMNVSDEGKLETIEFCGNITPHVPEDKWIKINTVVFNRKLYVLYFNPYYPSPPGCLWYARINEDHSHHLMKDENLNFRPTHKMSAVAVEDTLYLFFVDHDTKHLKYLRGIPTENSDEIQWLSNDPITLTDSIGNPLISYGNVAACSYFTPDNKERIMFSYPSNKFNDKQNYLVFYSGNGIQFSFHHQIASFVNSSSNDYSAYYVSLAQGTLQGGMTKQYMMQAAYVTKVVDGAILMYLHEFNLTTGVASGLERIPTHVAEDPTNPIAPDFMEYYIPDGNTREIRKYLYTLYTFDYGQYIEITQWESDLLKFTGSHTDAPPDSILNELSHLICVIEGPPPFALNGWTVNELWQNNKYPPSLFKYGEETTQTVGSNTVYNKTIEASGGFGPITGGFKRSMQHNNNNSTTDITKLSVITTIKPPFASDEAEGLMVYFYDAPWLMRSQWRLHDYNGDTLDTNHNLFLFNFTEPQLIIKETSFTEYSKSPRLNDIYSYVERNVAYFPGINDSIQKELFQDIAGGVSENQSIEFDTLYSNTTEMTKTIKVGIDAKYKIFSAKAEYEVTIDYTTENNTQHNHGFKLDYSMPKPVDSLDETSIRTFNTVAHLMKTVDSTAYFLPDGFKDSRPLFITWEVNSITHGAYCEFIDNKAFVEKYRFNCFPNPASSNCYFTFDLRESSNVQLILYDAMGHNKEILLNEIIFNGCHNIEYSVENLTPGLYLYKLQIGHDVLDGKLMVIH